MREKREREKERERESKEKEPSFSTGVNPTRKRGRSHLSFLLFFFVLANDAYLFFPCNSKRDFNDQRELGRSDIIRNAYIRPFVVSRFSQTNEL